MMLNTPCIEWTKARDKDGYGRIQREGRNHGAHRWFWRQAHGPIPDGMVVMHLCDNPPYINVEHLRLGTVAENNADKRRKGRERTADPELTKHVGTSNGRAKVDEDTVRLIRSLYKEGRTLASLGREFGINSRQVIRIVTHEQWKHVKDDAA